MRKERKRRTSWWPRGWREGVTLRASDKNLLFDTLQWTLNSRERERERRGVGPISISVHPCRVSARGYNPLFKFCWFRINSYHASTGEGTKPSVWDLLRRKVRETEAAGWKKEKSVTCQINVQLERIQTWQIRKTHPVTRNQLEASWKKCQGR